MVRLKESKPDLIDAINQVFRFQTGSIKSKRKHFLLHVVLSFRFQNGSIKSLRMQVTHLKRNSFRFQNGSIKRFSSARNQHYLLRCFDSKMVRLKDELTPAFIENLAAFRFQTGSIKSQKQHPQRCSYREFRFQNGSIKR